ncbi:hypothetical protein F5884DRAFT_797710 [Xylogone sp. PMI_703]|nr:hypothetical protein F5884DRAFT_797710 [Xylogone sp. PMI_703]
MNDRRFLSEMSFSSISDLNGSTTLYISSLWTHDLPSNSNPRINSAKLHKYFEQPLSSETQPLNSLSKNTIAEFNAKKQSNSRKGHKKSRQGCYSCKRRKVKCQETLPSCANCVRNHLECLYPPPTSLPRSTEHIPEAGNLSNPLQLQPTPVQFSLTDMRFFHHFLMKAHPHLPVNCETAWLSQIPLIAHQYEYLMHAILGLAASHLELLTGADYHTSALSHRLKAIKGSNDAIVNGLQSGSDADALLATCYALTFQSAYMSDGLPDFLQMVRGCSILSNQLKMENLLMSFVKASQYHFEFIKNRVEGFPLIHPELVHGADISVQALCLLCDEEATRKMHQMLTSVVNALQVSSLSAYLAFIAIYQALGQMNTRLFQTLTDQTNTTSQILIGNFLGIQMIMAPILDRERPDEGDATVRSHLSWVDKIYEGIPRHLRQYLEWPRGISELVTMEVRGQTHDSPFFPILGKKEGYEFKIV